MATYTRHTTKKGTIRHRAIIRLTGHPTTSRSFDRKADAVRWARATEAAIKLGKVPGEEEKAIGRILMDELIKEYLPVHASMNFRSHETERLLECWREWLQGYSVYRVTPGLLEKLRDQWLAEGLKPATVNRRLSSLSVVFEWAKTRLNKYNPVREVKKLEENNSRRRYLSDDERKRLWKAAKDEGSRLYSIVVLATVTGMRRGEILNLRWKDVDIEKERIDLGITKNGDHRRTPLKGPALEIIQLIRNGQGRKELVFGSSFPRRAWYRALARAGIEDFRFHDLRHSAASFLVEAGVDFRVIGEILGHRSLASVMRYTHLNDREKRKAFGTRWDNVTLND